MSQTSAMAGFTWLSPGSSSPPSETTDSALPTSSETSKLISSISDPSISSESLPMTLTASHSGAIFPSDVLTDIAGSQRTTHVHVTQTVTVTPTAKPYMAIVKSETSTCSHAAFETCSHTQTTSRPTASNADINRGEPFQMTQPLTSSIATGAPAVPAPQSSPSNPTNHGAIIGGLVGAFCGILILVLICTYVKRSRPQRKDEENGCDADSERVSRGRRCRSCTEITQEKHYHVRHDAATQPPRVFQTYDVDPVALANARNWQQGPGGIRGSDAYTKSGQVRRESSDASFGISLAELAQAQGWNVSFGANDFQSRREDVATRLPTQAATRNLVEQSRPVNEMPPDSNHMRYASRIHSVSPFTVDDAPYDQSGPRDRDDVSFCDSPVMQHRRSR